jgi:hypothetical protein
VLIADDEISPERLERIGEFARHHKLAVRRFTIALSNVHNREESPALPMRENRA